MGACIILCLTAPSTQSVDPGGAARQQARVLPCIHSQSICASIPGVIDATSFCLRLFIFTQSFHPGGAAQRNSRRMRCHAKKHLRKHHELFNPRARIPQVEHILRSNLLIALVNASSPCVLTFPSHFQIACQPWWNCAARQRARVCAAMH